jgi:hypothetical protein
MEEEQNQQEREDEAGGQPHDPAIGEPPDLSDRFPFPSNLALEGVRIGLDVSILHFNSFFSKPGSILDVVDKRQLPSAWTQPLGMFGFRDDWLR